MPCMCGDICCPSCGPAQGNWRCPICREWASEACEHMNEEGDDLKAEYMAQAEAAEARERAQDLAYAEWLKTQEEKDR